MNEEQLREEFEAWRRKHYNYDDLDAFEVEFAFDAYKAALEAARGDGWQPIETAPNEAWFLVHSDRGWIGLARRSDPDYAPDEGWFEDEHTEFLDPAWLTHWHPLPAPPAIDQARGKEGK